MASRQSGQWTISGPSAISAIAPSLPSRASSPRKKPGITGIIQRMIPGGETGYIDPATPTPGIIPAIQRVLPGGETGMTAPGVVPTPGIIPAIQRILPGGETGLSWHDYTPGTHGAVVKIWYANGTPFALNQDGTISVQKKNGTIKTYRPYKPTVFGKNPDAAKFIKMAKKHKTMYTELHKVFGRKVYRK